MGELDTKKQLALEQYKEIKASRRHYSNLRFALFPVYFAIQFGLVQVAQKSTDEELLFSNFVMPICGILLTYVFWTIETRINVYYKDLELTGNILEDYLEFEHKMMHKYSKKSFLNNTKLSIGVVYTVFFLYWLIVLSMEIVEKVS
ncbi:hypothetical protein SAMN05880501_11030 [Ureibacillus xyleni]|uniref:Uncharacterized protein n=1 Tax=Ureibacillus xyleni TaxID=614648 RepID=A0A285T991_9BACL|nr:hypothetical protein [Ureibacillus xyleni]SOC18067.1 hypothetical protein SAMN05880501_11030 [Ureibacillus xyleni]